MTVFDDILSGLSTQTVRSRLITFLALRRAIETLAVAAIARRKRKAALTASRQLSDRELRDIGIFRSQIGGDLDQIARERARLQLGVSPKGPLTHGRPTKQAVRREP